jgi:release factor glutamine methyltransferase
MNDTLTLADILKKFRQHLSACYPDDEIRSIFYLTTEYLLNYSKIDIHLKADKPILSDSVQQFENVLNRLIKWEPIQYITGMSEFYGLPIKVDRNVLIPRQETELLVRWVIENETGNSVNILDAGTGSGCIAVALAANLCDARISACDISAGALEIAGSNASLNDTVVNFFTFDILDSFAVLPEIYNIIISNPPYVTNSEKQHMLRNVLDFEPDIALFVSDSDPLLYYRNIALSGRNYLKDGGSIYFEINERYPHEVAGLLKDAGFYGIEIRRDLNGKPRMVRGRK